MDNLRYYSGPVWITPNRSYKFKIKKVFTIFCHGTGGHRDGKCKELITEFGSAAGGEYQKDFLILDGVGASDMDDGQGGTIGVAKEPHPMPGDFKPETLDKSLKPQSERLSGHKWNPLFGGWVGKTKGAVKGYGWNDNVKHAVFVLKKLAEENSLPEVINLIGWSRGAVTCLKFANALYNETKEEGSSLRDKHFDVNIFSIDPVPGVNTNQNNPFPEDHWDTCTVPPIVKNYIITLAMDEQREGFHPVDLASLKYRDTLEADKPNEDQNIVFLPYPGIHRTQLRMEPRDPSWYYRPWPNKFDCNDPPVRHLLVSTPHIVWDLAWKFLTRFGTRFKSAILSEAKFGQGPLSIYGVLEKYTDTMNRRAQYHQSRNRGPQQRVQGGFAQRTFTGMNFSHGLHINTHLKEELFKDAMGEYAKEYKYFINEYHRACFEKAFPETYNWYFGSSEFYDGDEVEGELTEMKEKAPLTFRSLIQFGQENQHEDDKTIFYGEKNSGKHGTKESKMDPKAQENMGMLDYTEEGNHGGIRPIEFKATIAFKNDSGKTEELSFDPRLKVTDRDNRSEDNLENLSQKDVKIEGPADERVQKLENLPKIAYTLSAKDDVSEARILVTTFSGDSVFKKKLKKRKEISDRAEIEFVPYKGRASKGWKISELKADSPLIISISVEPVKEHLGRVPVLYEKDPEVAWSYIYVEEIGG